MTQAAGGQGDLRYTVARGGRLTFDDDDFNDLSRDITGSSLDYVQFQLPATRFTRTDYTFTGWSTRPDGPVEYQNGQTVRNLTAEDGDVVNLYAVWKSDSEMEQLSQSFAGYDRQNYIGEDWNALEAAYEAGRAGIEAAAVAALIWKLSRRER